MGAMVESIRVMMPPEIMVIKTPIHRNMVWGTPRIYRRAVSEFILKVFPSRTSTVGPLNSRL